MDNPNAFGYNNNSASMGYSAEQQQQPPSSQPTNPLQSYKFSQDELRVLAQCNRDSFYQRSLPFGTGLGLAAYAAVQSGHLKGNPRFGAFPKVTLAVVVGYFLGKLSYQQACAEKLMALPGSYIGQRLRERRDGKIGGASLSSGNMPSMFGAGPSDIYSDAGPGSSLNLDTDRPIFNDDTYRPDNEGSGAPVGTRDAVPPRSSLSYDDLRRRNRGEHAESKQDPYRIDPGISPVITRPRAPAPSAPSTNKYGDIVD